MGNKAENVIEQIKLQCDEAVCHQVFNNLDDLPNKATPARQGKYIKACLENINEILGDEYSRKIMRPCGYYCISSVVISKAKKYYTDAAGDIEEFLKQLNADHIGGEELHIQDGKIIGVYESCYCGIPKSTKNMPIQYCECSAGWFERLFTEVLEREVKVKIKHTILNGASNCVFEIEI